MSIWSKLLGLGKDDNVEDDVLISQPYRSAQSLDPNSYAFVDAEIGWKDHRIHDLGALRHDGAVFQKRRCSNYYHS